MSLSDPTPPDAAILDFDPFVPPDRDDPYPTLRRARRERPVFFSRGLQTWVVTRYDDVLAVVRDPQRFSSAAAVTNRPGAPPPEILAVLAKGIPYEPNSVDLDPPQHGKFRHLIRGAFTPRRIAGFEPHVRALADALVDEFVADGEVDLVARFAYPLPMLVIGGMLGIPREDMDDFKRWSDEWLVLLGQLGDMPRLVKAAGAVVEFQHYVASQIADRRARPGDDLVSAIVAATADMPDPPTDNALVGLIMTVLFAGHETTTSLITSAMKQILGRPEVLAEVLADRAQIPAAITETLRFDPPVPGMYRTTTTTVELGGVTLAPGQHMQLSFASANRDEAHFPDPDRFDIHRPENRDHLAFGHGIHACIGAALAQLEARVAVETLLDRLPRLCLVPDQPIVPVVSATIRGTKSLLVAWG